MVQIFRLKTFLKKINTKTKEFRCHGILKSSQPGCWMFITSYTPQHDDCVKSNLNCVQNEIPYMVSVLISSSKGTMEEKKKSNATWVLSSD